MRKKNIFDVLLLKIALDIHRPEPIDVYYHRTLENINRYVWTRAYLLKLTKKNPNILNIRVSLFPLVSLIGLYSKVKSASHRQTLVTSEGEGNTDGGNKTASSNMIKGGPEIPE